MPRDEPGRAPPRPPPWLDPALIRAVADCVIALRANGVPQPAIERECRELVLASRPAWPMPWIEEAAAIALWAGSQDQGG